MHYAKAGSGPRLIIFLHGFPQCWWSWRHQLARFMGDDTPGALSQRFTAIAPDLRGYNETDRPNWGYNLDTLADDIAALIHELGFQQAVVAGHDWGGGIAWWLAIRHPHLVERLVILNSPHPAVLVKAIGRNWQQTMRSWYMLFFQLPWLPEAAISANNYAAIEQMMRGSARRPEAFTDEDITIYKQSIAKPGALSAAIAYYREQFGVTARGLPPDHELRVDMPVLLIWGEDDVALGKELTYPTGRYAPLLTIRYVPRCSHWVHEEQPDLVSDEIIAFLLPEGASTSATFSEPTIS
ncbi:MAG TPA: alpha/beta hydrolase [Roseiflexaceae bacterium]|nr:alpha/beta hydrolase [Roseiflexaceae bacterium]